MKIKMLWRKPSYLRTLLLKYYREGDLNIGFPDCRTVSVVICYLLVYYSVKSTAGVTASGIDSEHDRLTEITHSGNCYCIHVSSVR